MFRVRIEAPETYRSSVRPVILASVRHVMENLGLNKNVLTFFNGEAEVSRMIGTNFTDGIGGDKRTDVGYHDRQFIVAEEDSAGVLDELDSCHRWVTNPPFWQDPITKSMIVPMFVTRKYNIAINRYFKDRVMARQYRDRVNNTLCNPHLGTFNAIVHYPIGYDVLECFEDIYTRLNNAGMVKDNLNAFEWFKSNALVPTDVITNLIGNNACFVFKRSLEEITLLYNGVSIAKAQKGKYQGQYITTLEYSFYHSEHTRYELHYPIIVYQQLTNPIYIPTVNEKQLNDYPVSQFYEASIAQSRTNHYMRKKAPYMFVFPKEDNFRPPEVDYLRLKLQRLAMMEDIENQLVLNIFKFSGLSSFWLPEYEAYIKKYHDKITIRHKNPFHIRLWSDDYPVEEKHVTLDKEGNLYLKHRPTMSAAYRVCFYFDLAVWLYDDDCVDDIVDNEDDGRWIIDKIIPSVPVPDRNDDNGNNDNGDGGNNNGGDDNGDGGGDDNNGGGNDGNDGNTKPDDNNNNDNPWIDWEDDIIDKVIDRDGDIKKYMMDALLIADNEDPLYKNNDLLTSINNFYKR